MATSQPIREFFAAGKAFLKVIIATAATELAASTSPSLSAGAGAASASESNGSLWLRTNGVPEFRVGDAWKSIAVAGQTFDSGSQGIKADAIAESTSAAGVTVDGCLIKDGRAAALATAAIFLSSEVTGNGSPQNTAHGFGATPSLVIAIPSNLSGGAFVVTYGTHDATNCVVTATTGEKYRILALK